MAYLLIVDDELDSSEPIARYLRRAGHEATCVPGGRDAIASLSDRVPDLILLDMRMPEMSGLDVLDVVRSYLRWQDVPVIILTAFAEAPEVRRASELNVTVVIDKIGLDLPELLVAVETCLHSGGNAKAAGGTRAARRTSPPLS